MSEIVNDAGAGQDAVTRLIQHAWTDESFRAALIADPSAALQELGVSISDDHRIEFYDDPAAALGDWNSLTEGSITVVRVPIPAQPDGDTASAAELAEISGGSIWSDIGSWFTPSPGDASPAVPDRYYDNT